MITDSELNNLVMLAERISFNKHMMKISTNPRYVEMCQGLNDDLTEDLCDQIERLYFKIKHRREKNET